MSQNKTDPKPSGWARGKTILTGLLWLVWISGPIVPWLAGPSAPVTLWIGLALLLPFLAEIGLLIRYRRVVGQWRMVILAWLAYAILRLLADRATAAASETLASMLALLVFYALLAGYGALTSLAIRRDVSVAYFLLPFIVMPILLQSQIRASGSLILAMWGPPTEPGTLTVFTWLEPLVIAFSCMTPLAVVTFWGHFVWLLIQERRRQPLPGLAK